MPKLSMEFRYTNGALLTITNKSLKDTLKLVLDSQFLKEKLPFKLTFTSTKKVLYFDDHYFRNYIQGNCTLEELIENTQCEELYRNKEDFIGDGNFTIDAGSLWKLENKALVLVDDDNVFTTKFDLEKFEIA